MNASLQTNLGTHILADLWCCDSDQINDVPLLTSLLSGAAEKAGAMIVKADFHRFEPQGVSGVVVIAQSHITIHTWPELGYAALDVFTCGDNVDPLSAVVHVAEGLKSRCEFQIHERGIPKNRDEQD